MESPRYLNHSEGCALGGDRWLMINHAHNHMSQSVKKAVDHYHQTC